MYEYTYLLQLPLPSTKIYFFGKSYLDKIGLSL